MFSIESVNVSKDFCRIQKLVRNVIVSFVVTYRGNRKGEYFGVSVMRSINYRTSHW